MTKEELLTRKICAISLGCDKNRVDLEKILGNLSEYGFEVVGNVQDADIVIINTCAFILPAKQEAISQILEMEYLKKNNKLEKVIVTGCFPERNYDELKENFPSIDAFVKVKDNPTIPLLIEKLYGCEESKKVKKGERILTTPQSYAYLKIADGCNNACSYCAIPRIRGRYKSEKIEDLVDEAENLVKRGVKEIVLVAQDVSRYGEDLYGENKLIDLCKKIAKIKGVYKIRLHYLYPEKITDELLNYIASEDKICKYLDLPLQHIDNDILLSMRRRLFEEDTRKLITNIKSNYPNLYLRTTFIVGYPDENEKQFKKLCDFLKEVNFDYAGFFPYYREENTASYFMKNQNPTWKKMRRLKIAQKLQGKIASRKIYEMIGKEFDVLVDSFDDRTGYYFAHTEFQSPDVDFNVVVKSSSVKVGDIVKVKFTDFNGDNFEGDVLWIYQIK